MSCVFIEAGQCGNQLGYTILEKLLLHYENDANSNSNSNVQEKHKETFFRKSSKRSKENDTLVARAVCLDTEPKVIGECVMKTASSQKWSYDSKSIAYLHGGAGNNWAAGYDMCSGEFLEKSMNSIRYELEYCDYSPFLFIIHSLAGGTGSGLGTKITESVGELFPEIIKITSTFVSDGTILFENEVAQYLCKTIGGIDRPTMRDINNVIASNVMPILLPKYDAANLSNGESYNQKLLSDDIRSLCHNPCYKLLDVKTVPQTFQKSIDYTYDSWGALLSTINRMQTKGSFSERGCGINFSEGINGLGGSESIKTVASVLTFHGHDSFDALNNIKTSIATSHGVNNSQKLYTASYSTPAGAATLQYTPPHCSNLLYTAPITTHATSYRQVNGYQRSISVLSNSNSVVPFLQRVHQRATDLYTNRAYLHQYSAYGVEESDFVTSFQQVGQIINNYQNI